MAYKFCEDRRDKKYAFNDGLIINASSIQESAVAIRAFTDGYEGGMSKVTAEGNIDINANDGIKAGQPGATGMVLRLLLTKQEEAWLRVKASVLLIIAAGYCGT